MVSAAPRHADAGYYCDGGDDGLVNISNTYGATGGYRYLLSASRVGSSRYRRSFMISGLMTLVTVLFRGRAFFAFLYLPLVY